MNATTILPPWLAHFPSEEGLIHISQGRRFAHDEASYDSQYSNDPAEMRVGQGLIELLKKGTLISPRRRSKSGAAPGCSRWA